MDIDFLTREPVTLVSLLIFLYYTFTSLEFYIGVNSIRELNSFPLYKKNKSPFISFIIPARNEQDKIEEALSSVLNLDYNSYEVIVINDRSEDSTGEILDRMSAGNSRLKVFDITSLPPGWLGKNYVLDYGAKQAQGEYYIFTDADVIYSRDTLSRVVSYLEDKKSDHLSMGPAHIYKGIFITAVISVFEFMFMMKFKPWKVSNMDSKSFIGIGSFNLVRASVYRNTGGFETLKMRPDDDIMLGKLIKMRGFKSDFLFAPRQLRVEWYSTVSEMMHGMYKNVYAGFNYNILFVIFSVILLIVLS